MTEAHVLQWFNDTPLGVLMRAVPWLFSVCETLHFIGLTTLFGAILLVDLRLLGFLKRVPIRAITAFIPVAIAGFAINALTGLLFFTFDPPTYWHNPDFRLKMFVIGLAGLNALWFAIVEEPRVLKLSGDQAIHLSSRISAGLSISLWIVVIVLGRLLEIYAP